MTLRRTFFKSAGATLLGAAAVSRAGAALLPEAPTQSRPPRSRLPSRPPAAPSAPW